MFVFVCLFVFVFLLSDKGREFQTVGSKTENDLLPKVSRQKQVLRSRRLVWMKKARRVR